MVARAPVGVDWAAMPPETADLIRQAAIRITTRRDTRIQSKRDWLRDGFDIGEIREAAPHGTLSLLINELTPYTPGHATDLARAADMLADACKSRIIREIPEVPATVCVELAKKATPQHVRDKFLPLILAGERVKVSEIKAACKPQSDDAEVEPEIVAQASAVPSREVVSAVDSMTDSAFRTVLDALAKGHSDELIRALEWRAAKPVVPHADRIAEKAKAAARAMPLFDGILPAETVIAEPDADEPGEAEAPRLH